MNRILHRMIAVLLIPALLQEPVLAIVNRDTLYVNNATRTAFTDHGSLITDHVLLESDARTTVRTTPTPLQNRFAEEALGLRDLSIEHHRPGPVRLSMAELLYARGLLLFGGSAGGPWDSMNDNEMRRIWETIMEGNPRLRLIVTAWARLKTPLSKTDLMISANTGDFDLVDDLIRLLGKALLVTTSPQISDGYRNEYELAPEFKEFVLRQVNQGTRTPAGETVESKWPAVPQYNDNDVRPLALRLSPPNTGFLVAYAMGRLLGPECLLQMSGDRKRNASTMALLMLALDKKMPDLIACRVYFEDFMASHRTLDDVHRFADRISKFDLSISIERAAALLMNAGDRFDEIYSESSGGGTTLRALLPFAISAALLALLHPVTAFAADRSPAAAFWQTPELPDLNKRLFILAAFLLLVIYMGLGGISFIVLFTRAGSKCGTTVRRLATVVFKPQVYASIVAAMVKSTSMVLDYFSWHGLYGVIGIGLSPFIVKAIERTRGQLESRPDASRRWTNGIGFGVFLLAHAVVYWLGPIPLLMALLWCDPYYAVCLGILPFPADHANRSHDAEQTIRSALQNDPLMSLALERTAGFQEVEQTMDVLLGGKDYATRRVLYHQGMTHLPALMRYLFVRRALGFYFDDRVEDLIAQKRFTSRGQPIDEETVVKAATTFWVPFAAYENLKRATLYPKMIPFMLLQTLVFGFEHTLIAVYWLIRSPRQFIAVMKTLFIEYILSWPTRTSSELRMDPLDSVSSRRAA